VKQGKLRESQAAHAAEDALSNADEVSWRAGPWKWPRDISPRSPRPAQVFTHAGFGSPASGP